MMATLQQPTTYENDTGAHLAVDQVLKKAEKNPELRDMLARALKTFSHTLIDIMPDIQNIKGINAAAGSEFVALLAQEALKHDPLASKRARLKLQGQIAFRHQIEQAGGVYSTEEVAKLLNISSGAVRKRLERGRLLSVPIGEKASFPVWQFGEEGVVKHFPDIMSSLKTSSPIGVVQFFLTFDEDLGETPIEALKSGGAEKLELVKILAEQHYQQVAR